MTKSQNLEKVLGQIFGAVAVLIYIGAIMGQWLASDKIDAIYLLCVAIGLMLISNRMINDAKEETE